MPRSSAARKNETEEGSEMITLMNMTRGPLHAPYGPTGPTGRDEEPSDPTTAIAQRKALNSASKLHTIWPGLNLPIKKSIWQEIARNETVKSWTAPRGREGSMLEIVDGPPTDVSGRHLTLILDLSASVEAMEWWLSLEARDQVKKDLKAKIKEMKRLIVVDTDDEDSSI